MGSLKVMNADGHTVLDETNSTLKERNVEFDRLVKEGHLTYRANEDGTNELVREFDPQASIIATPNFVGG